MAERQFKSVILADLNRWSLESDLDAEQLASVALDLGMQLSDKVKIMKKSVVLFFLFFALLSALVWASPPVAYSGKVAINGENYHGQAKFAFAIHDANGTVHWRNGETAYDTISVNVANGRYVVHLGGQGMNPLPASLFADHDELYVGVRFDIGDGKGLRNLAPDQRITAVPYAKVADIAKRVENSSITTSQLNEQILKYLKPEITLHPQAPNLIFSGQTVTLNSQAEGKFLTYQWSKNGQPISGAVLKDLVITDSNSSLHDGNYTLVVTNDFGSVETQPVSVAVVDANSSHRVQLTISGPRSSSVISLSNIGGVDYRPSSHGFTDYSIVANSSPVGPIADDFTGSKPDQYSPHNTNNDWLVTLRRDDANNIYIEYAGDSEGFDPLPGLLANASVKFTIQYNY